MSGKIITCGCGAKIRVPTGKENRAFRCPKCKQGVALTVDATPLRVVTKPLDGSGICPICQTAMSGDDKCVQCPGCEQLHHQECWSEIGGCGTYGCAQAPAIDKSEQTSQTPLTAWGDTKTCPACGEEIKAIALRCRYCKTDFSSVDPMSRKQLRKEARSQDEVETLQKMMVGLFATSFIGCLAPIVFITGLVYLMPRRQHMSKCNPIYALMGWASLGISGFFSVLLILFILAEMLS